MACPVCMRCGACGKKIEHKTRWVPGMCPICEHLNESGSVTCMKCGAHIPLPPGMAADAGAPSAPLH